MQCYFTMKLSIPNGTQCGWRKVVQHTTVGGSFFKEHKYTTVRQLRQQHPFNHYTDQNRHP